MPSLESEFPSVSKMHCVFTCTSLQHHHHTLAISCRLHTDGLLVHQAVEAERVPGLQVVGFLRQKNDSEIYFSAL